MRRPSRWIPAAIRAELAYGIALRVDLPGVILPKDGVYAVLPREPSAAASHFADLALAWFGARNAVRRA